MLDSRYDLLLESKMFFDVDGNGIARVWEQASGGPFVTAAIRIVSVLRNLCASHTSRITPVTASGHSQRSEFG